PFLPPSLLYFFHDTPTPELYTLSLHDALPISGTDVHPAGWSLLALNDIRAILLDIEGTTTPIAFVHQVLFPYARARETTPDERTDRKSTRLNSSHVAISYAVFCLKKKKEKETE